MPAALIIHGGAGAADPDSREQRERGLRSAFAAGWNVLRHAGRALDAVIRDAYSAREPVLAYYWEPTPIIYELNMVRLEEPEWTQDCQDALNEAVQEEPYESEVGCAYRVWDVHTAVHRNLQERAPEVTTFLGNVFIGVLNLAALEAWKYEHDVRWSHAAVYYLKNNRDVWTTWITDDNAAEIIANVDAALALE